MHRDVHEGLVAFANALLRNCIAAYVQQLSGGYNTFLQSPSASGIKIITSLNWNAKNMKSSIQSSMQFQTTIPAISFDLVGVKGSGNIVFRQNKTFTCDNISHLISFCVFIEL